MPFKSFQSEGQFLYSEFQHNRLDSSIDDTSSTGNLKKHCLTSLKKIMVLRTGKKENCFLILDSTMFKKGNECSDKTPFIGQINLVQTDNVM